MTSDHKDTIEQEEKELENTENGPEISQKQDDQENSKAEAEITLWKDQCMRISAEFENYKKRVQRDQAQWTERAKESVLKDLLPFVDDFERALQQTSADKSGIEMMYQSLLKILEKNHITVMQIYDLFDPEFHEAVMQVASDDHESGQIVEVFSKGFMIQGRVLRPAQVSVAQ